MFIGQWNKYHNKHDTVTTKNRGKLPGDSAVSETSYLLRIISLSSVPDLIFKSFLAIVLLWNTSHQEWPGVIIGVLEPHWLEGNT